MIIDTVEKLKHSTSTRIRSIQESKIPILYKLEIERRYSFDTHGFYHSFYRDDSILFLCKNLPFNINKTRHVYADTLENMVNKGEIQPFLLFINNRFIKWSDISIICDHNYSYICINNNSSIYEPKCEAILLPRGVIYKEAQNTIPQDCIFAFNIIGKLVDNVNIYDTLTTISLTDKDVYRESITLRDGVKQDSTIDSKFKITKSNFIIFKEGSLYSSAGIDIHGLGVFSVDNNVFGGNSMKCKSFYYTKIENSVDNITNPINKGGILSLLKQNVVPSFVEDLAKEFDFSFDRTLTYDENVSNAILYIMRYNSSLLDDVYKSSSNIVSKIYTGKEIKALSDITGYVRLSRRMKNNNNNYPMIFKNGILYEGYREIQYINKDFIFPIINILDTDTIEILYFTNIDNRIVPIYLASGEDDIHILDPSVLIENMRLYTINPETQRFNIERSERTQYEITFRSKRLSDDTIEIKLNDSFNYDRNLNLASDKQFRYMCKVTTSETLNVQLSDDFRFCSDSNRYIVFINGRKIDYSNFRITIAKNTRPFDDTSIYINIPLKVNDRLEVFYVSERLDEVSLQPTLEQSGIITINRDNIKYGLNGELYFVFVNGVKLNSSQLNKMNSNRLKIHTNMKSTKNVCIVKHINDNFILANIFKDTLSTLDNVYNTMDKNMLESLFATDNTITNVDKDIQLDKIDTKQMLYHIINDYYMRPYINDGDVFEYDSDDLEFFNEKDSDDNIIIRSMDASISDKVE